MLRILLKRILFLRNKEKRQYEYFEFYITGSINCHIPKTHAELIEDGKCLLVYHYCYYCIYNLLIQDLASFAMQLLNFDIDLVDTMLKKLGVSEIYLLQEKYDELRTLYKVEKGMF